MCECENGTFEVKNNVLYIYDDYLQKMFGCSDEHYTYCPICGENLKLSMQNDKVSDAVIPAKFIYRDPCTGEESPIRFMEYLDEEKEEKTI